MYVLSSYTPDEEVVLEKNPNYWGEATNVDKYIFKDPAGCKYTDDDAVHRRYRCGIKPDG